MHQASDDQVAVAICLGAVAVCGLLMHFSHHVGRMTGHIRQPETMRPSVPMITERLEASPARDKAA